MCQKIQGKNITAREFTQRRVLGQKLIFIAETIKSPRPILQCSFDWQILVLPCYDLVTIADMFMDKSHILNINQLATYLRIRLYIKMKILIQMSVFHMPTSTTLFHKQKALKRSTLHPGATAGFVIPRAAADCNL